MLEQGLFTAIQYVEVKNMFMVSFRLSRKRMVAGVLALALVVCLGYVGVSKLFGSSVETSTGSSVSSEKRKNTAKTNEQRVNFAKSFGWELQEEPVEILEVIVPKEFDETYNGYNTIQKQQGYNLEKYAGKRCKRYSYLITNYPSAEGEVRLNMLVYNDKIIGGDVCSMDLNGFMHGFPLES